MKALLKKELIDLFSSKYAGYIAISFVLVFSTLVWGISLWGNGEAFNYLALPKVLTYLPYLLIIAISAFCAISFEKEERKYNLEKLLTNPIKLYWSKFLPVFLFTCFLLLSTLTFVFFEYWQWGADINFSISQIVFTYCSLWAIATIFIALCLTFSMWVHKAWLVLVLGVVANSFIYFDWSFGAYPIFLAYHYDEVLRGVLTPQFVTIVINCHFLTFLFVIIGLQFRHWKAYVPYVLLYCVVNVFLCFYPTKAVDFTPSNKCSLSEYTKSYLKDIERKGLKVEVNVHLESGKEESLEVLSEKIVNLFDQVESIIPHVFSTTYHLPLKDKIHPYIELTEEGGRAYKFEIYRHVFPDLLYYRSYIGALEYEVIKGLKQLLEEYPSDIAFIEGHGELDRVHTLDAEQVLSQNFNIHRGQIGEEVGVLDDFAAVIIAGPQSKFTEGEKFVLNEYIMQGGKVLWLIDGVYISQEDMKINGWSASMPNDVNLGDLLLTYGVRIKPQLIQDRQCMFLQVVSDAGQFKVLQSLYTPHIIFGNMAINPFTTGLTEIQLNFASPVELVSNIPLVRQNIFLSSSVLSRLIDVPERIELVDQRDSIPARYFNRSHISIGVALDGQFYSHYSGAEQVRSVDAKMIVIGSSSLIKNELKGQGESTEVIPMGYDRLAEINLNNGQLLENMINWLVEDEGLLNLKQKGDELLINNEELIRNVNVFLYTFANVILSVIFFYLLYFFKSRERS